MVLVCVLVSAVVWGLWQKPVRISRVSVVRGDPTLASFAMTELQGTYWGIIPHDSIFFFPARAIRANILNAHSDIAAVSISRSGFSGISIKTDERIAIATWCGLSPTPGVEEYCYLFDANGFVYAAQDVSSTTPVLNPFKVYAPLVGDTQEPLRASIAHADNLPSDFDFARQLQPFGSPVVSVVINNDEVTDILVSGSKIIYVLGDEQNAFSALTSAKNQFNLADGSVDYVDLRFDGKVYLKKKDQAQTQAQ